MVDVWLFTVDCFSSPCLFPACLLVQCYYTFILRESETTSSLASCDQYYFPVNPILTFIPVSYLLQIQAIPSQNGHADDDIRFRALQVVDVRI